MENFDYKFYTSFYPDRKQMNEKEARYHYFNSGKKEQRVCNINMLQKFQNETNKK